MPRIRILAAVVLTATATFGCHADELPTSGEDVLHAMHDRYAGIRPASLVIVQQTLLHHKADAPPDTAIWYEAAVPGRLRIDFAPVADGSGALYRDGTLYVLKGGRVAIVRREVNPLQVLLMDVFQVPPVKTVETLDTLGYDLSILREDEWEDRPVWVVGAVAEDDSSAQFWIDRERLVALRVVQPVGGGTLIWDTRVTGFRDMEGYPQEERMVMFLDGKLIQEETYVDVRAGVDLDPALFDTTGWTAVEPYWPQDR